MPSERLVLDEVRLSSVIFLFEEECQRLLVPPRYFRQTYKLIRVVCQTSSDVNRCSCAFSLESYNLKEW
jgi:hypothetical protein